MSIDRPRSPTTERMAALMASVLLVFALTRLIDSPRLTLSISLPGFYFAFPLTLGTGMTLFAAALAATGMNWLIGDALALQARIEHLMLPTLTTLALGSFLALLPNGTNWQIGLLFSAGLLASVFFAEGVAVDPSAPASGLARAGLTALAYALFLISAAALRFSSMRMFLLAPILFLVAGLISLRIQRLDGADRWDFPWAVGIGIVCMQIGAGLHYWYLTPLQFGVALTGPLYALTLLAASLAAKIPARRAAVAPVFVVCAAWIAAVLLR